MRAKNPGIKGQRKPLSEHEKGRQGAVRMMIITLASLLPAEEMMQIMKGVSRNGRTDDAKRSARVMDTVFSVIQLEDDLARAGVDVKGGNLRTLFEVISSRLPGELAKQRFAMREYRAGKAK